MRPSKLLWLVLMSVVLRSLSTQQYPMIRKQVETSAEGNGDYYDYVYADDNEFGNDMDKSLDAAADGILVVPGISAVSVNPDCEPIASATTSASSVETACLPVSNSRSPATTMGVADPTTCEPAALPILTSPPIPPTASTTLPASSTTVFCDRIFMNAAEQIQQMDNCQQQRVVDASSLAFADGEQRSKELRTLVQHLYVAQARVQLEATEIRKAQAVASTAQSQLEESANHVRSITATLHNAQQEVAAAAIRAQIAQLQLAAHDQLLFAARQDVDALSSQMVGLQAAEGIIQPRLTVDLHALLDKLKQPLQQFDRPTPVPLIVTQPTAYAAQQDQERQSQGIDLSVGTDANGQMIVSCDKRAGGALTHQSPVRYPNNLNNKQSENARQSDVGAGVGGGDGSGGGFGGQHVNINYT